KLPALPPPSWRRSSASRLHRVTVTVKLAGDAGVELDRLHWRVFRIGDAGKNFQHLFFPDVDGHGEGDSRLTTLLRIARLADAVRRRREDVIADALHVIAGVEDDRPARRGEADPLHVSSIQHLQPLDPWRRQKREEIDVLVTEKPGRPGVVHLPRHRRVVVEPESEGRSGQLLIVEMRIAAMTIQNGEADLAQRVAEVLDKRGAAHVAGPNLKLLVELLLRVLRQVILLALLHLLVADEVLIPRVDPVVLRLHVS